MTVLNVSEESSVILNRLRVEGETDEALMKRLLDYAESYMIIYGVMAETDNSAL